MKIGEYEQMMSYLTRPEFSSGSGKKPTTVEELKKSGKITTLDKAERPEKAKLLEAIRRFEIKHGFRKNNDAGGLQIVEPSRSMQVDTTTKGLPDALEEFKKQADMFLQASFASTNKDYFNSLIEQEYNKALDAGVLPEEALSFLKQRSQMYRTLAEEGRMQGEPAILGPSYGRENKAIGGGAFVGKDLGSREGFAGVIKPVSKLPEDQQKFINKWLDDHPGVKWEDLTNNERGMLKKGQDVRSGTGSKTKKGAENPQFQPLNDEGKKIAKQVYGTTEVSDNIRQRINKGEITMDTKPVKFEKGKDISLKMKRGSETVTGVNFPEKTIDADGNIETAKQMEKRFINFLKNRVQFSKKGLTGTGYANADIAEEFPISEKQGGRLARYYINKLGLKYKVGPRDPGKATVTEKATEKLKVTSGIKEERKLTQLKTKILKEKDLARKVDKAHRVSKSHMEKLGLQFDTNLVGMDSRIINQVIVKPSEIKLNNLYARQRKVLDLLKENPDSVELKNRMTEINKGVKQIVKDTSGRLIGVTIDLDTLEPTFEGIKKKNTFTKFLGDNYKIADLNQFSDADLSKAIAKAVDAEAKRGFVPNDFKNILTNKDSQKAILEFAKKRAPDAIAGLKKAFLNPTSKASMKLLSTFPVLTGAGLVAYGVGKEISEGRNPFSMSVEAAETGQLPEGSPKQINPEEKSFLQEYPLTTGALAAASPLVTKPGRKIYGALAKPLLKAFGSVPAGLYFSGKELSKEDPNLMIAGADLLLPELGKRIQGSGSGRLASLGRFALNPFQIAEKASKFGKIGRGIASIARIPTLMTPIGLTLAGAGAIEKLYDEEMKEKARVEAMSPEDRESYLQEKKDTEELIARASAAYGGRMGFADGPEDPSKRKFMKIMGGLASLPIIGRFFDVAKEATPIIEAVKTEVAKGKPEWFDALVNKVIAVGEDVTKRFATKEREIVNQANIADGETVRVYQELDTGTVRVEYENPDNMGGDSVNLVYKKELPDEGNPNPSPDFYATELEPRGVRTGPDDYDIEFDGENYADSVEELMSDTTKLKEFATGKKRTMKEIVESKKKTDKTKAMNESTLEQAEYLESKYGPGDDLYYQDYSDYD